MASFSKYLELDRSLGDVRHFEYFGLFSARIELCPSCKSLRIGPRPINLQDLCMVCRLAVESAEEARG